jgi:hypothetical protein
VMDDLSNKICPVMSGPVFAVGSVGQQVVYVTCVRERCYMWSQSLKYCKLRGL